METDKEILNAILDEIIKMNRTLVALNVEAANNNNNKKQLISELLELFEPKNKN